MASGNGASARPKRVLGDHENPSEAAAGQRQPERDPRLVAASRQPQHRHREGRADDDGGGDAPPLEQRGERQPEERLHLRQHPHRRVEEGRGVGLGRHRVRNEQPLARRRDPGPVPARGRARRTSDRCRPGPPAPRRTRRHRGRWPAPDRRGHRRARAGSPARKNVCRSRPDPFPGGGDDLEQPPANRLPGVRRTRPALAPRSTAARPGPGRRAAGARRR